MLNSKCKTASDLTNWTWLITSRSQIGISSIKCWPCRESCNLLSRCCQQLQTNTKIPRPSLTTQNFIYRTSSSSTTASRSTSLKTTNCEFWRHYTVMKSQSSDCTENYFSNRWHNVLFLQQNFCLRKLQPLMLQKQEFSWKIKNLCRRTRGWKKTLGNWTSSISKSKKIGNLSQPGISSS